MSDRDRPCTAVNPKTGHRCSLVQPSDRAFATGMIARHGNWHKYVHREGSEWTTERWRGRFKP